MDISNKKYKGIGIHVIASIFTIDKGVVKVLLIKRTNEPYKSMWSLVGGAMYNDELIIDAAKREIKEKTNLDNITLEMTNIVDDISRSPMQRMIGHCFIGLVDIDKIKLQKETTKTSDAKWFSIDEIPELAYDHNKIISQTIEKLKELIVTSSILKELYPNGFTIPEIQQVYESILNKKFDRRNFRKKILATNLVKDTKKTKNFIGKKPAKLYKFNNKITNKKIF